MAKAPRDAVGTAGRSACGVLSSAQGGISQETTKDGGYEKHVDIVIEGPDRSEALDIPPSLEQAAARAAACPANWLLRRLAEGVVARERRYEREVTRVRLNVWLTRFDRVTLSATERPLRTFVYDVR